MDNATRLMLINWLAKDRSEDGLERLARFLRDSLKIGGIRQCRALIAEAIEVGR